METKDCDKYINRSNNHEMYLQKVTENSSTEFDQEQWCESLLKLNH